MPVAINNWQALLRAVLLTLVPVMLLTQTAQAVANDGSPEQTIELVFDDNNTAEVTLKQQPQEGTLLVLPTHGATIQMSVQTQQGETIFAHYSYSTLLSTLYIRGADCQTCTVTIAKSATESKSDNTNPSVIVRRFDAKEQARQTSEQTIQDTAQRYTDFATDSDLQKKFVAAVHTLKTDMAKHSATIVDRLRVCGYEITNAESTQAKENTLAVINTCMKTAEEQGAWHFKAYLEIETIKTELWFQDKEQEALSALKAQLKTIAQHLESKNDPTTKYILGRNLLFTGMIYSKLGKYPKATKNLERAKATFIAISNYYNWAEAELEIGTTLRYQNQLTDAAKHFENAYAINQQSEVAHTFQQNKIYYNMAVVSLLNGQYYLALNLVESIYISQSGLYGLWPAHINALKARIYLELHRLAEAEALYAKTWKMYEDKGATSHLATLANNLSRLHTIKGNIERAEFYTEQALKYAGDSWGSDQNIRIQQAKINHFVEKQQYDQALAELDKLEQQLQATDDYYRLGRVLGQKGETLLAQTQFAAAVSELKRAKTMHDIAGDYLYTSKSDYLIAKALFLSHADSAQIQPHIESAISVIESVRSTFLDDRIRQEYFALQKDIYDLSIQVQLQGGAGNSALTSLYQAESFKARTLFENLNKPTINTRAKKSDNDRIAFDFLKSSFEAAQNPFNNQFQYPKPTPKTLLQHQASLLPGEATLYYFLANQQSYLWYINRDSIEVHPLNWDQTIAQKAEQLAQLAASNPAISNRRGNWSALIETSQALSKTLLAPIADKLEHARFISVIPDGVLHRIPFSILLSPQSNYSAPLINATSISYANSIAMAQHLKDKPRTNRASKGLLMVANPHTPASEFTALYAAEQEANNLITLWGQTGTTKLLLGELASKRSLYGSSPSQYQVIHFASHAYINWENPAESAIKLAHTANALGTSSDLTQAEISSMNLNAELVVLSACETATGRSLLGEGPIGLSRAFFEAGANRVLASLWPVEDNATAMLLELFYVGLLKKSLPPDDALQYAQKMMMQDQAYSHPYFWSGFIFIGNSQPWHNASGSAQPRHKTEQSAGTMAASDF